LSSIPDPDRPHLLSDLAEELGADLADELGADLAPRLRPYAYHVALDGQPVLLGHHAEAALAELSEGGDR
jgi:hypothetical protein